MKKLTRILRVLLIACAISSCTVSNIPMTEFSTAYAATTPTLKETKKTLYVGQDSYTIQFKNLGKSDKVTYISSNKKVATVSKKGVVKPLAVGKSTITAVITKGKKTYRRELIITVKTPYITITNPVDSLEVNKTRVLKAKTYGLKKASLQWSSNNSSVLSVGKSSGKVTAKKAGTAKITVKDIASGTEKAIDIIVTAKFVAKPTPAPKPNPTPSPTPIVNPESPYIYKTIYENGFENGVGEFASRGGESVAVTTSNPKSGKYSLITTGRQSTWQGPVIDMTEHLKAGKTYQITGWLKYSGTESSLKIQGTMDKNSGALYQVFGEVTAVINTWIKLEASLFVPQDTNSIKLYYEIPQSASADLYLDDFSVVEVTVNEDKYDKLPSITKAYEKYFDIGVAISANELYSELTGMIVKDKFATITFGNEMKPDALLDYETNVRNISKHNTNPAIRTDKLKEYLQYAKDHDLKVRFHTLVWHSQTPRWFFTENYSKANNAPLVSKAVMLQRMENYIKNVMECASAYPGVIYAWDVVNEAIEPGHNKPNGYRSADSLWYQIIGEEFVEKAFEYARKYSYDDGKLFYNDYNEYMPARTNAMYNMALKLKEKGLIDGIGMQSHIDMGFPSIADYEKALRKFGSLGLEIQVTELDMHNNQNTELALEKQADRYKQLFEVLLKVEKEGAANITNVTFWGLFDSHSWLTNHRKETSYPLLFDGEGNPKKVYYQLVDLVK